MPGSTLTVRTLALATVGLILACGHAVQAMGSQRAAADRAVTRVAPPVSPIRVVPAGSGHSTIATFSNTGASRSGGGSSGRVATFTSRSGGSGATVVSFNGDRVDRRGPSASTSRRPQTSARNKTKGGILPPKGDPPVIAVRRAGSSPIQLESSGAAPLVGPPAPQVIKLSAATPSQKPQGLRNAFGGLNAPRSTPEASSSAPLVYARASVK